MKTILEGVSLLLCVALCTGCYSYRPVQTPQAGMDVRARLNAAAAARRSEGLDEPLMRVEGKVVESTPSSVAIDVLVARNLSTFQGAEIRDTVVYQIAELQSVLQRTFSPTRTLLFTIGAAAAAFAVVTGIDQVVGGTDEPIDPGTPTMRAPLVKRGSMVLFRWPFD